MVSKKEVLDQLKKIDFKYTGWGRTEVSELPHIILPGEEIYECVNGIYEGGFALLVATDLRVLLVDKKPLNFLTVEDMRFDMISEMDYNHRLMGADIGISAGDKNLRFRSYNQKKLRKLIGHVQHCMAEAKKQQNHHQDDQVSHLEQINRQLQAYLAAQQKYQIDLQKATTAHADKVAKDDDERLAKLLAPPKPSNELADYLYAQSLLEQYKANNEADSQKELKKAIKTNEPETNSAPVNEVEEPPRAKSIISDGSQVEDIYAEGLKEVFGDHDQLVKGTAEAQLPKQPEASHEKSTHHVPFSFDINPLHIAYSKLPMALRIRKFSKPSLHNPKPMTSPDPWQA